MRLEGSDTSQNIYVRAHQCTYWFGIRSDNSQDTHSKRPATRGDDLPIQKMILSLLYVPYGAIDVIRIVSTHYVGHRLYFTQSLLRNTGLSCLHNM